MEASKDEDDDKQNLFSSSDASSIEASDVPEPFSSSSAAGVRSSPMSKSSSLDCEFSNDF